MFTLENRKRFSVLTGKPSFDHFIPPRFGGRGDSQGDTPLAPFQIGGPGGRNRNLPPGRFFRPFLDGTRKGPAGGKKIRGADCHGPRGASQ